MTSPAHQSQYGLEGYQPYEHQQNVIPYNRSWHIAKIGMRSSNIVFNLIVISLSVYVYVWTHIGLFLIVSGFPAAVAMIWDVAELITVCARGGKRGIHPGAHVGLHLIFWLIFAAAVGIQSAYIYIRDEPYSSTGRRFWFIRKNLIPMQNTVLAFTVLLLINHFTLFVRACVETNQRNRRAPVFMVPISAPPMQPHMVAGAYVPYPHQPQQAYSPAQQNMASQNMAPQNLGQQNMTQRTEFYTPPGPDGTYYAPTG
ncbi:hypothetical protein CkaCkLH20_08741 [Colletotrichum karsti]|uniref:Uncharacterized protein n=1 Tax=Colletotrichum karsti TaxID=1095194 RepID=A0A9P6LHX0_9PEZI|nr:uncharacterized protein CkaCkLH20_08741 [Colletotrichum karsti]KAF9873631.1 hypothetical protein CkaCkLH20_08741 [Colletotrichum karsti]